MATTQDWGALYRNLQAAHSAQPLAQSMQQAGLTSRVNENGQTEWGRQTSDDGFQLIGSGDGQDNIPQQTYVDKASAFNPRDITKYGILPLSAQFNGNIDYTDASIAPQNSGNLVQFLSRVSGDPNWRAGQGGTIENDPYLGPVWVPREDLRASFDPFQDFSPKRTGGALSNFVNGVADSGGIVKAAAGAILAPAIGDLYNFATGAPSAGGGTSLASGTPDASWGVNPQTPSGPMSTTGGQFVDPNTLQMAGGAPMSTTGSLASNSFLPTSAASIGSAPFNLDDFIAKRPTTGNKLVDSAIEKAAQTALQSALTSGAGAANQAGAGTGGDTTAADQQAAEEARKQALIEQINAMYDPSNFIDEEGKLSDAIRGQQGDALKLGYDKASRATTFDAARRGNVGGSVMADNIAGLNRDNQLGATKIEDAVNSALSGLRSARLSSQGNAISLVNAGSGPEGVNAAATGIKNAIDSARAEKIPDITQGLFQNVALSNQAINTGNNTAALGAYINARTSGGGSLFPLGSRAAGYSVPT